MMTLTEAHSTLVNFVAAFEAAQGLAEAAKTVLDTVGDQAALERQVATTRETLERAQGELAQVRALIDQTRAEHETAARQLHVELTRRRDELDQEFRRHRDTKREESRQRSEEYTKDVATQQAELKRLDAEIGAKRGELNEVQNLVRSANAELDSVRQLVARR